MRLYIAGPMTGLPNYNFDEFNRVADKLARCGHEVYNPATTFNGDQGFPYDIYIREALRLVTMVNGMVLLKRWWTSRGALCEVHAGLTMMMPFYDENMTQIDLDYPYLTELMKVKYGSYAPYVLPTSGSSSGTSDQVERQAAAAF